MDAAVGGKGRSKRWLVGGGDDVEINLYRKQRFLPQLGSGIQSKLRDTLSNYSKVQRDSFMKVDVTGKDAFNSRHEKIF